MATENRFALLEEISFSTSGDVNALLPNYSDSYDVKYFLGLLNSKLLNFYHKNTTKLKRGGYMEYVTHQLLKLPIREINFINAKDKHLHDLLVTNVVHIVDLQERTPQTPFEQEQLQREIAATDAQIDRLVYDLYGLTEEEIKIVEENK